MQRSKHKFGGAFNRSLCLARDMVLHVMKTTRSQKIWNETKMKKRAKDVKRVRASKKESSKQGMAISRSIDVFQGRCEKAKDQVGYDLYMYTSNWFYTEKTKDLSLIYICTHQIGSPG